MSTFSHFVNAGTRPIGTHEFIEALRAICPPRFAARTKARRTVGLAVSGGVDSMALAYLCVQLRIADPNFRLADHTVLDFRAFTIDHRLREGSKQEADAVRLVLREMGIPSEIFPVSWAKILTQYGSQYKHPKELPNAETIARRLRYRTMGRTVAQHGMASVLFAHHEDDQYETVLMRLLQGHGVWGLRGIKAASEIPECEGIYGAYQSGYVDNPEFYNIHGVSRSQYKALRSELRSSINTFMEREELREPAIDMLERDFEDLYQPKHVVLDVDKIDSEDGGVMIYRPLLGFPKDRMIATCEANGVPWFEDATNQDSTLTMRNAVRNLYKNYTLPVALQKPAILALSRRCDATAQALEAEANRLLEHTVIHDFELRVGSLSVQFPDYKLSRFPRDVSSPIRLRARLLRQREVAGLLIRRVIALVSPEEQTVPLANLQDVISRLFPSLSDATDNQSTGPPKAFVIAGVYFVPIEPSSRKGSQSKLSAGALTWFLSRTPYLSHQPIPRCRFPWSYTLPRWEEYKRNNWSRWSEWSRWGLWDGRFWLRTRYCLPYRVILQPFLPQHAKAFRELLPPAERDRLAVLLKRYAPGKTRFTLPALYLEEDLDLSADVKPRQFYPMSPAQIVATNMAPESGSEETDPKSDHPYVLDVSKMKLIALPSLDVQIPHLDNWLEYEIRFRRIDRATLGTAGSFYRGPFLPPRLLRAAPLNPVSDPHYHYSQSHNIR
ncbi:adenine nucleotide alpha hydrolases-like protein [Xylaria intraflava]|nr:adenine nucleotide alpha hydrolases-like protein [Xylaria intraflava]